MAKDRKTAQDLASGSASRPFANDQTNRALDEGHRGTAPATRSSDRDVAEFIARMRTLAPQARAGRGRLIFAMDATMSRQPTWDMALGLQADMFRAVKEVGGLDVQLVYFRGAGECRASKWVSEDRKST